MNNFTKIAGLLFFMLSNVANSAENLGRNKAWEAWKNKDQCYIIAFPSEPKADTYLAVSLIGDSTELSYNASSIIDNATVKVVIDDKEYSLYSYKNKAFVYRETTEEKILNALLAGSKMYVESVQEGNTVVDDFNLSGVTATLKRAKRHCK